MSWRAACVQELPPIKAPVSMEFVSRLPRVTEEDPTPLSMEDVILLIPGFDPHRESEGFFFDAELAQRAVDFIHQCCTHVEAEWSGRPFIMDLWQQAIVANLFGWVDGEGLRRFREVFVLVPRKNGKTLLASAIVLYLLFCDEEPGAQIYSTAADLTQASIVFDNAEKMIENDEELEEMCRIYSTTRCVQLLEDNSSYRALTKAPKSKHGFNTHAYVMDELHAQANREMLDVLNTSMRSRRQPVKFIITTRDFAGPSICNEKQDFALGVCKGLVSAPRFLPVLYFAEGVEDWKSEEVWRKANPGFGISIKPDAMKDDLTEAEQSAGFQNEFKRLYLNMETQATAAAYDLEQWEECKRAYTSRDLEGEVCYGGLDLASTRDLTAFVLWFPEKHQCLAWFWVPEKSAYRRDDRDRTTYAAWATGGYLTLTDGEVLDDLRVVDDIVALSENYDIQSIAFDRMGAVSIVNALQRYKLEVTSFGQGFVSMSAPTKELDRLIGHRAAGHNGHPVLRWCIGNAVFKQNESGQVKLDKARSREKIDGAVALVMAIGESMTGSGKRRKSVYSGRGMRTL